MKERQGPYLDLRYIENAYELSQRIILFRLALFSLGRGFEYEENTSIDFEIFDRGSFFRFYNVDKECVWFAKGANCEGGGFSVFELCRRENVNEELEIRKD